MKKGIMLLFVLLTVSVLTTLVGCSFYEMIDKKTGLAEISFTPVEEKNHRFNIPKAVYPSIVYEDVDNLVWKLTAQKTDSLLDIGKCNELEIDIKTYKGVFSVGSWEFSLNGYKDNVLIYSGNTSASLQEDDNKSIAVVVDPVGDYGYLKFDNFYFETDFTNATKVKVDIDNGDEVSEYSLSALEKCDYGYVLNGRTKELAIGEHSAKVQLLSNTQTLISSEFNFSIKPNMTTTVTRFLAADGSFDIQINKE